MEPKTPAERLETMYSRQDLEIGIGAGLLSRPWVWVVVAIAIGATVYRLLLAPGGSPTSPTMAQRGVAVSAAPVKRGDFNRYLTALGSVTPFNTVTVKSRVDGQLVRVDFKEGQSVREGELLAEVDPRPFQVQLAQAQGQLARDLASLKNARVTLQRDRTLFADGVIASQDLDNQQSAAEQYQGAVVSDRANIDNAKLQLTYSRITAPLSGRIGLRLVDPGNIVHAADTSGIAVITQLQPIAVLFSIPEDDLPKVLNDVNNGTQLEVDAYDRDLKNKLANGSLLTFDNQIDPGTGTIRMKASFSNQDNSLFPNQFVNVRFLVDTMRDAIIAPAAAVQRSSLGAFVYVVRQDQTVDLRNVTVLAMEGESAAIQTGLTVGELVVTDGVDKLQPGAPVRIQPLANVAVQRGSQ